MICGIEGVERRAEMRDMAALHIVNHVVKSRNKIWAGNCLLRKDKVDLFLFLSGVFFVFLKDLPSRVPKFVIKDFPDAKF